MGLSEALDEAGGFGPFHYIHFIFLTLSYTTGSLWHQLAIIFQGYYNDHHCRIPANSTLADWLPITKDLGDGQVEYSQCQMYTNSYQNTTIECPNGWTYDRAYFDEDGGTIVMEWDLVCSRSNYVELHIVLHTLGLVLGAFLCSPLGDHFGRKIVLVGSQFFLVVFGVASAFAPNFEWFCVLSLMRGLMQGGVFTEGMILSVEIFPKDLYSLLLPLFGIFTSFSQASLVFMAYFIRDWRTLQLVLSLIPLLYFIYFWWCPESIHWLVDKGYHQRVLSQLQTIARMNGGKLNEEIYYKQETKEPRKQFQGQWKEVKEFIKKPKLSFYLFCLCYVSFAAKCGYFGLHYMQGSLAGNLYANFAINAAVGVPGYLLAIPLMYHIGRRSTLALFTGLIGIHMSIVAICLSQTGNTDINTGLIATGFALSSKIWIGGQSAAFAIMQPELAPTRIRSTIAGISNGFGMVGTMVAPFISITLNRVQEWLPGLVLAIVSFLGVVLTLVLPETVGRGLPASSKEIADYPRSLDTNEKATLKKKRSESNLFKKTPSQVDVISGGIKNEAFTTVAENGFIESTHM